MDSFTCVFHQLVTYTGYSNSIFSSGHPKHHTKVDTYALLNYTNRIKRNTEEHIHRAVSVPALPPSSLEGCGIIDISYFVEVFILVKLLRPLAARFCIVYIYIFFCVCFFLCVPQLYLWGSPLLGEIFAYVTVFKSNH